MCNKPRTDIIYNAEVAFTGPLNNVETSWISSEGVYLIAVATAGTVSSFQVIQGVTTESGAIIESGLAPENNKAGILSYSPTATHFKIRATSPQNWSPTWPKPQLVIRDMSPIM